MPTALLVITNSSDATADFAIGAFQRLDLPYRRLDTDRYPREVAVTLSQDQARLDLADGPLDLGDITAVWWRRPVPPVVKERPPGVRAWAEEEARLAMESAWRVMASAQWVNHPDDNRRAQDKVRGLLRAADLNLNVPAWLVTNLPNEALRFAQAHRGAVVVKPLGAGKVDGLGTLWTTCVDEIKRLASVGPEPYLLQRFVRRRLDVRVTVIGEDVFAVAIDTSHVRDAASDWRRAAGDARYSAYDLPPSVRSACLEMVRADDLCFAAIDFAWDGERLWFLEVNPNGQWAWLEEQTGLPLSDSLAKLLARHVGR